VVEPIVLRPRAVEEQQKLANEISERLSQELVIALVGPVGSGVSTSARYIAEILKQQFGYDVAPIIGMSDIIRAEARRVSITPPVAIPINNYINVMQNAGNELRSKFGNNYLAEKAVERIAKFRGERGGTTADGSLMPGRRAYIIDSLKNAEELALLHQIYRETLLLFGVFAPDEIRKKRLVDKGADEKDVQTVVDRDQGEVATFGQMTRKIFVLADFFICNDKKEDELKRRLNRYLEIIFDTNIHTPTKFESAMYEATAAMAGSACMSRQTVYQPVAGSENQIS
jgi:dephospho-CoA kinase